MPDQEFSDSELLQVYKDPRANLANLTPGELQRMDRLTSTAGPAKTFKSGLPPSPFDIGTTANPVSDDPNAPPRVRNEPLERLANPTSLGDFLTLAVPNAEGTSAGLRGVGQGLQWIGQKTAPLSKWGMLDVLLGPGKGYGAAAAAGPQILSATGRGASALGDVVNPSYSARPLLNGLFVKPGEVVDPSSRILQGDIVDVPSARAAQPTPVPGSAPGEPIQTGPSSDRTTGPFQQGPSSLTPPRGLPPGASPRAFEMPASDMPPIRLAPGTAEAVGGTSEAAPATVQQAAETLLQGGTPVVGPQAVTPQQPLGMPRVIKWAGAPGEGLSQADALKVRLQRGSREGAASLAIPQQQLQELTSGFKAEALPLDDQARIREALSQMSPEETTAYLSQARNPLARNFILSLFQQR